MDFDNLVIGKKYIVTGGGVITDKESGVVLGTAPADSQFAFVAIGKGVTLDSEGTILPYEETSSVAVGVTSSGGGGDTPGGGGGDYSDYIGYIEYDDATGAIVDMSIPKYLAGNLTFKSAVLPEGFTDWKIDMPYLTNGEDMFYGTNLTSFSGDLSNLTNGDSMFQECTGLTSFSGDLPKLISGNNMFYRCKLDAASVERILSTIPTYTDGSTHDLTLHFSSEAAAKFEEITGVTPTIFTQAVSYKGWTIRATIIG